MKISLMLILAVMIIPVLSIAADKKTVTKDANPTVVIIKDGTKTTIPFSLTKTDYLNPDSIESVSVKNDTLFIQLKSVKKTNGKRSIVKK